MNGEGNHRLVTTMALANFICVKSSTACSCQRAYRRAFPAASNATDDRATRSAHGSRQFISVLLPERALVAVAVINRVAMVSVSRPSKTRHRRSG